MRQIQKDKVEGSSRKLLRDPTHLFIFSSAESMNSLAPRYQSFYIFNPPSNTCAMFAHLKHAEYFRISHVKNLEDASFG